MISNLFNCQTTDFYRNRHQLPRHRLGDLLDHEGRQQGLRAGQGRHEEEGRRGSRSGRTRRPHHRRASHFHPRRAQEPEKVRISNRNKRTDGRIRPAVCFFLSRSGTLRTEHFPYRKNRSSYFIIILSALLCCKSFNNLV